MSSKEITLLIEDSSIKVEKAILTENSDYFKAMLDGNFVEKDKSEIVLQEVDLQAMNKILTLLQDPTIYIEDEDVLMILQTSCMLQFNSIRDICQNKIVNILSVENCLKIWIITEQLNLNPLDLKAKTMALIDFLTIKDSEGIMELSLEELCRYLGNINLQTDNEYSVVQVVMRWWYEHESECISTDDLLKLLSCVDFNSLSLSEFKEFLLYPSIKDTQIGEILTCLFNICYKLNTSNFSTTTIHLANLLNQSRKRTLTSIPCFSARLLTAINSKRKADDDDDSDFDIYPDESDEFSAINIATTRTLSLRILNKRRNKRFAPIYKNKNSQIWYFDYRSNKFEQFFCLNQQIEGYKIIAYKEYIFVFGGEYELGRGKWNNNFSAYNPIKESWQKITTLPFDRRHFQSCVVGSKIYIVGGTGFYRINQENVFWYDFKEEEWSREKKIPFFDLHLKSCEFMNKLFLFSLTNGCGYFLDDSEKWVKVPIIGDVNLVSPIFSVFSYQNKFYIRGDNLIELEWSGTQLVVSSTKKLDNADYSKLESLQCGKAVFTLRVYRQPVDIEYVDPMYKEYPTKCDIERIDLETGDIEVTDVNKSLLEEKAGVIVQETSSFFSFAHYSVMAVNELVNNSFIG